MVDLAAAAVRSLKSLSGNEQPVDLIKKYTAPVQHFVGIYLQGQYRFSIQGWLSPT